MFRHLWWRLWWHEKGTYTPGWMRHLAFGVCWQRMDFNPKPQWLGTRIWRIKW